MIDATVVRLARYVEAQTPLLQYGRCLTNNSAKMLGFSYA